MQKILVIDDSRSFLLALTNFLQELGHSVRSHSDGSLALAELEQQKPDVIVCDLEMPGMHGFEFIRRVRECFDHAQIQILVLTSTCDAEAMNLSIEYGADAFAQKSALQQTIKAQLCAFERSRAAFQAMASAQELQTIKALIGTYRHEFGNSLAIAEGSLRLLLREKSELQGHERIARLEQTFIRLQETLKKLSELRQVEHVPYTQHSSILKVG